MSEELFREEREGDYRAGWAIVGFDVNPDWRQPRQLRVFSDDGDAIRFIDRAEVDDFIAALARGRDAVFERTDP